VIGGSFLGNFFQLPFSLGRYFDGANRPICQNIPNQYYAMNLKKACSAVMAGFVAMVGVIPGGLPVRAAATGSVVINEVAWAGSADSANDEWIELYNTTALSVDLGGWILRDDGVDVLTFPAGAVIGPQAYFLIEDSETAVSNMNADLIFNMSLANTGDTLQLADAGGQVIDTVNAPGGAWYAGSSTNYATMERIDALVGDLSVNFVSSTGGSGALASAGSAIIGTPRALNSMSTPPVNQPKVTALFDQGVAVMGETVTMTVRADNLSELFSYGFELVYDPAKLQLGAVTAGGFLSAGGTVATSFQSGLVAGEAGNLLVAEARTIDPKVGVSGSGNLFSVNFTVVGGEGGQTSVIFAPGSFASSTQGDLPVSLLPASLGLETGMVEPVTLLQATQGIDRYQIRLNWMASLSQPDHYRVERMDAHGQWQILAGVAGTEFVDQDGVLNGGNIVPNLVYQYRVTAVKGSLTSQSVTISAQDSRGIRGDNNRSDRIDGRDLERLALHFAESDLSPAFDPLIDTTYDALINGSDLIDIGAAFAQRYP